jgi:hypothetical protein
VFNVYSRFSRCGNVLIPIPTPSMIGPLYDGGHYRNSCVDRLASHNKNIGRRSHASTCHLPIHAFRPSEPGVQPLRHALLARPKHSRRKGTATTSAFFFFMFGLVHIQLLFLFFFVHLWFYILVHSGALFHSSSTVSLAFTSGDPGSVTDSFFCSPLSILFLFQQASIPARLFWLPVSSTVSWHCGNCLPNQGWFGEATRVEEKGELFSRLLPTHVWHVKPPGLDSTRRDCMYVFRCARLPSGGRDSKYKVLDLPDLTTKDILLVYGAELQSRSSVPCR